MKTIALNDGLMALVDDADFDLVSKHRWHSVGSSKRTRYAAHAFVQGKAPTRMHRYLMGAAVGQFVDHIDGNGLNNQRSNLRFAKPAENSRNHGGQTDRESRYKGVSRIAATGAWTARIMADGKRLTLGRFKHQEEAALAYDAKARELHGEFARCKLPGRVMTPAESLLTRTTAAIRYTLERHRDADFRELWSRLPVPRAESDIDDLRLDARVVHLEALTYASANAYALCLMTREPDEAGKFYRRDDVQEEIRARAMRVAESVFSK